VQLKLRIGTTFSWWT